MPTSEHRRHVRQTLSVEFRGTDSQGIGELVFEAADLSVGGAFLKADLLLEQGERLALTFQVPGVPRTMKAEGRVAWVRRFPKGDQSGGMGVEFVALSDEDRSVLTRYLGGERVA